MTISVPSLNALTITEDFTSGQTMHKWLMPKTSGGMNDNKACLTAGDNTGVAGVNSIEVAGSPPACEDNIDQKNHGALRLTNTDKYIAGGVISDFSFPSDEGLDMSYLTYTYGGISGYGGDGMTFFLTDASYNPDFGATGGALGYSCANAGASRRGGGISGAYLGIGMDTYGSFVYRGDNSDKSSGLGGLSSNTIALRGAGSINLQYLQKKYPAPLYRWSNTGNATTDHNVNSDLLNKICGDAEIIATNGQKTKLLSYPLLGYKKLSPKDMPLYTPVQSRAEAIPINYRLKLTSEGLLSLWVSYNGGLPQPIMIDADIVKQNGPIPKEFRFGFVGATGGAVNNNEITCFKAAPNNETQSSTTGNIPDAEHIEGTQLYTALFNSLYWYGQLVAQNVVKLKDGTPMVETIASWDAGCNLTGGDCSSTNKKKLSAINPNNRQLITYSTESNKGIPFRWESLSTAQKNALNLGGLGEKRVNYYRGSRADEAAGNNSLPLFRKRFGILGDSVQASPVWVGPPNKTEYNRDWIDARHPNKNAPENSGQSYSDFKAKYNSRTNMVYLGANDGYLHGFRSGAYDATGKQFAPSLKKANDGQEVFAYMPNFVLKNLQNQNFNGSLSFSDNKYSHNFYLDAAPGVGDVYFNKQWHTWLLSGIGNGGSAILALDITDPTGLNDATKAISEAKPSNQVIGEWGFENDPKSIWNHLGNTYGTPEFGRFHNGKWGAVFGNGWCTKQDVKNGNCSANVSGQAGIYIMLIDEKTGKPSFKFISTQVGNKDNINGIAYVTLADLDGDQIVDYAYAGDLQGNVWRFDLTADNESKWEMKPQLLFSTPNKQPISTKILVSKDKKNAQRVIATFGTGRLQQGYLSDMNQYAKGTQSFYGIWDKGLGKVNPTDKPEPIVSYNQLLKQEVNFSNNEVSSHTICWSDNQGCTGKNAHDGWYIDLGTSVQNKRVENEQVIFNPIILNDVLVFNSLINTESSMTSCEDNKSTGGYTYALQVNSGGSLPKFFDENGKQGTRLPVGTVGDPYPISIDGKWYILSKNEQGLLELVPVYFDNLRGVKRLSWRVIFKTASRDWH